MQINRRDFLGEVMVLLAAGCSADTVNVSPAAPGAAPPGPKPGPGTAGAPNALNSPFASNALSGTSGAPATGVAGTPSLVVETSASAEPAIPAVPKFGTLRGKISTSTPHATKHAVVYLANGPLDKIVDARIDDIRLDFHPHVSVMTAGGTLTYVNNHPFPDSCFTTNHEKFDFGYVEAHGVRKRKFPNPGQYTLLCHVHPNEVGFLIVAPSHFLARVNKAGEFVIADVPVGNYELVAWAPRMKMGTRSIAVIEGEVITSFALTRKESV